MSSYTSAFRLPVAETIFSREILWPLPTEISLYSMAMIMRNTMNASSFERRRRRSSVRGTENSIFRSIALAIWREDDKASTEDRGIYERQFN